MPCCKMHPAECVESYYKKKTPVNNTHSTENLGLSLVSPFVATVTRPRLRETLCGNTRQPVWKPESQRELESARI